MKSGVDEALVETIEEQLQDVSRERPHTFVVLRVDGTRREISAHRVVDTYGVGTHLVFLSKDEEKCGELHGDCIAWWIRPEQNAELLRVVEFESARAGRTEAHMSFDSERPEQRNIPCTLLYLRGEHVGTIYDPQRYVVGSWKV